MVSFFETPKKTHPQKIDIIGSERMGITSRLYLSTPNKNALQMKSVLCLFILSLCLSIKGVAQVSTNTLSTPYPIVFIHGITGGFKDWEPTIDKISNTSFKMGPLYDNHIFHNYINTPPPNQLWLWNITYYTPNPVIESVMGNLDTYTQRLDTMIQNILTLSECEKVILIAHSMGGLIARNYMIQSKTHWDRVHKVVTVGTPHNGVITSIGIVGQLEDLRRHSPFIQRLNKQWDSYASSSTKKWGVIGAIDARLYKITPPFLNTYTDGGGPGFVELSSSIPYGEWAPAFNKGFLNIQTNTTHFGYRQTIIGQHKKLVEHPAIIDALQWAVTPTKEHMP